jgi:hypothetical protein
MTPETRAVWMAARTTHGAYLGGKEAPEHYVWRTMIARCTNPKSASYLYYGGRGIKVCKRWQRYELFLADMGPRPSPEYSLERKNTQRGYMPSNCRWATRSEQQKNKTTTRWFSNGKFTGTLVECAAHIGISKALALWRWKTWGSFEKDISWQQRRKAL